MNLVYVITDSRNESAFVKLVIGAPVFESSSEASDYASILTVAYKHLGGVEDSPFQIVTMKLKEA